MRYLTFAILLMSLPALSQTLRIATFNVSMEASNYVNDGETFTGNELFQYLETGEHPQIRNIAEIIQRVRPDIILLNEFDYTANNAKGIGAFQQHYLAVAQNGQQPVHYPHVFVAPSNTGVNSGVDLTGDGIASGIGGDAFGFGLYPGQYGMVLLSKYPIDNKSVRTFQRFLWKDMPNNLLQTIAHEDGRPWFSQQAKQVMRLSSKSHWDVPIKVGGQVIHVLASHPTPPVFDGPEDRNGKRNHDEIRFWADYLSGDTGNYIYDDKGVEGAFKGERFVVMGDQNASPVEGDTYNKAILQILSLPRVNTDLVPQSAGGKANQPDNPYASSHTAGWGMRVDYALPSKAGLELVDGSVFWPEPDSPLHRLVASRKASSDHKLVWVDVAVVPLK